MKTTVSFAMLVFVLTAFKSDKPAYQIYLSKGKVVNYSDMLNKLEKADIIIFGEMHDSPIAHWLQYEITKDLHEAQKNLVLGSEVFEADIQLIIDEYLIGFISEKKFESEAKLWRNYITDYKPLINFAKNNSIYFVATNVPRRYASVVYRDGFEGLEKLTDEAKSYFAPLPIKYNPKLDCYKSMLELSPGNDEQMGSENMPKAEAIKHATMAHYILKNWKKGDVFLHFNGVKHSDNHEGIIWYLKKQNPSLNIVSISTVYQQEIDDLDAGNLKKADFIITVPETMTRTH